MSTEPRWRKSSYSADQGNCVEVAELPDGTIGMRDSKHPAAAVLTFSADQWAAFLAGCKAGEFES